MGVLISLCVYGLAAAAPQLGQNLNQEVIVNDVVTALQPSIAEAVANALRGLSTSSVTSFNSGSAGFSGSSSSSNSGSSTAVNHHHCWKLFPWKCSPSWKLFPWK